MEIAKALILTGSGRDDVASVLTRQNLAVATSEARAVTPEEVASAIVWLCSDRASGVNGGIIHVSMGNYMRVG